MRDFDCLRLCSSAASQSLSVCCFPPLSAASTAAANGAAAAAAAAAAALPAASPGIAGRTLAQRPGMPAGRGDCCCGGMDQTAHMHITEEMACRRRSGRSRTPAPARSPANDVLFPAEPMVSKSGPPRRAMVSKSPRCLVLSTVLVLCIFFFNFRYFDPPDSKNLSSVICQRADEWIHLC